MSDANQRYAHFDRAVAEEHLQPIPMVGDVAEFFSEVAFGGDAGSLDFEPDFQVFHQRLCEFLACRFAVFCGLASDLGFHAEFADQFTRAQGRKFSS